MNKVVNYAASNAEAHSVGHCGLYVNDALRKGGFTSYGHGKDVARNLVKSNQDWQAVKYDAHYTPQHGDVMSIGGYAGQKRTSDGQLPGHVAIYDAQKGKWISDFVQHNTRGNTAAANNASYQGIKNGTVAVFIARKI